MIRNWVQVVAPGEFTPYIFDLQTSSWHGTDALVALWLEHRPWARFGLGTLGTVVAIYLINRALLTVGGALLRKVQPSAHTPKPVKLA